MTYLENTLGIPPMKKPLSTIFQRVYPNPFIDNISIELRAPNRSYDEATVTLYSASGLRVYQSKLVLEGKEIVNLNITTNNLASGVYYLEYKGMNDLETLKLVHL